MPLYYSFISKKKTFLINQLLSVQQSIDTTSVFGSLRLRNSGFAFPFLYFVLFQMFSTQMPRVLSLNYYIQMEYRVFQLQGRIIEYQINGLQCPQLVKSFQSVWRVDYLSKRVLKIK